MNRQGFSSFILVLVITLVLLITGIYLNSKQNNEKINTNQFVLKDVTKEQYALLPTDSLSELNFRKEIIENQTKNIYLIKYNNPWTLTDYLDDNGCIKAKYSKQSSNLGELVIEANCTQTAHISAITKDSVIVSKTTTDNTDRYIIRKYNEKDNSFEYNFLEKPANTEISETDLLTNIISIHPFKLTAIYYLKGTDRVEDGLRNTDTIINSLRPGNGGKPMDANYEKGGTIKGTIELTYELTSFPDVMDDIKVLISEKKSIKNNLFAAVNCKEENENCVWLDSSGNNSRTYKYKLTQDGGGDSIRSGESYTIFVSTRHWNESKGNIAGERSEYINVKIPESGETTHDFKLTVKEL